MILRERVPCRISRVSLAAIVLLGLLTLPGWSQNKADPANRQAEESISAGPTTKDETTKKPAPAETGGATSKPAVRSPSGGIGFGIDVADFDEDGMLDVFVTNNYQGNREARLQKLEQQLEALLQEVRGLQRKKAASGKAVAPKTRAQGLLQEARSDLNVGRIDAARLKALEANNLQKNFGINFGIFDDRPQLILAEITRRRSGGNSGRTGNDEAVDGRHVVDSRTITLTVTRTTYRLRKAKAIAIALTAGMYRWPNRRRN